MRWGCTPQHGPGVHSMDAWAGGCASGLRFLLPRTGQYPWFPPTALVLTMTAPSLHPGWAALPQQDPRAGPWSAKGPECAREWMKKGRCGGPEGRPRTLHWSGVRCVERTGVLVGRGCESLAHVWLRPGLSRRAGGSSHTRCGAAGPGQRGSPAQPRPGQPAAPPAPPLSSVSFPDCAF